MNPVRNLSFLPHLVRDWFATLEIRISNRVSKRFLKRFLTGFARVSNAAHLVISNGVKLGARRTRDEGRKTKDEHRPSSIIHRFSVRTALGIDISDGRINLALLEKSKNGVRLLKTATGPVPDGAVKDGNIEDATALAKAIKALKVRNKIRAQHAAVSLVADPALMQILGLPEKLPANIGQFVQEEVKHYAMLPIENAAIDFCGIKSSGGSGSRRVLVVATDSQKITDAAKTFNSEGLNIDSIEPASVAYIRGCYAKKIAERFDRNLLFAIVHQDILTLCLFRNQALDFVRTKRLEPHVSQDEKYFDWLAEEINAVLKFYEFEVPEALGEWEVNILTGIHNRSVEQEAESLRAKLKPVELEVRTPEDAYLDTPVADTSCPDRPSAVAVGLAMKLLSLPGCTLNINLLPPVVAEAKSAEKQTLVIANVAAAILLLMILSVGFFSMKVKRINANIQQGKQMQLRKNTQALLDEQGLLSKQIANLSKNINRMNVILSTGSFLRWDQVLNDISLATPKMVRITKLSSKDNSKIVLEGQALSHEAIYLFVDMLNACRYVKSASLIGAKKDSKSAGRVDYSIRCSLSNEKDIG